MICSICGKPAVVKNITKKYTTTTGMVSGGFLAVKSACAGAAIGRLFCPVIGDVAGGVLGFLTGAMAGGAAGNAVGKLVDENLIRIYHCDNCNRDWRTA